MGEQEANNTRLVVGMALATGAAGWIPVPLAGGWAVTTLRRLLLQQIARRHGIAFDRGVPRVVVGDAATSVGDLALDVVKAAALRDFKTALKTLPLMIRFSDILETLVLGAYFDRYCATHHEAGAPIDLEVGRKLRVALEEGSARAAISSVGALLRHLAGEAGRLALATPRAMLELLFEAITRGDEAAERVIEEDTRGLFRRAAEAVEGGLSAAGEATLDGFRGAFDEAWGAHAGAPQA